MGKVLDYLKSGPGFYMLPFTKEMKAKVQKAFEAEWGKLPAIREPKDPGPSATDRGSGPEFLGGGTQEPGPGTPWPSMVEEMTPVALLDTRGFVQLSPQVLAQLQRIEDDLAKVRNWIARIKYRG